MGRQCANPQGCPLSLERNLMSNGTRLQRASDHARRHRQRRALPQSSSASRYTTAEPVVPTGANGSPIWVRLCVRIHTCAKGGEPQCARADDWIVRSLA